jgi:poly(ADP-ribose) glycohydrolase ARH3
VAATVLPIAHAQGCLLGTLAGESVGSRAEGMQPGMVRDRYPERADILAVRPGPYGPATEMTAAVAASLAEFPSFNGPDMAKRLLAGATDRRGYGQGTAAAIARLAAGEEWNQAGVGAGARASFGNGAALRSAPVGLLYGHDVEMLRWVAEEAAGITHQHSLGAEGAVLQAVAVAIALASRGQPISPAGFLLAVGQEAQQREFRSHYEGAAQLTARPPPTRRVVDKLGNGQTALGSVVTAAYCFALNAESFESTIAAVFALGGNASAIAAMAGAISGVYLGVGGIPAHWLAALETGSVSRASLMELGARLAVAHEELVS